MTDTVMAQRSRSKSPVHIHLEDGSVPVHVHVEKPKKPLKSSIDFSSTVESHNKPLGEASNLRGSRSNVRRSTVTVRNGVNRGPRTKGHLGQGWRSSQKANPPGMKYSWMGPSHRLDIMPPTAIAEDLPIVGGNNLSDGETEDVLEKVTEYERKLQNLRSEVGSLKYEVENQRAKSELAKKEDLLESSLRVLQEQEEELEDVKREHELVESENRLLRHHVESLCEDLAINDSDLISPDTENLMKKLVEAEVDGRAISDRALSLVDAIQRLREDKRLTAADSAAILSQHINLLRDGINQFAVTNSALRGLLRNVHDHVMSTPRLSEQRDVLLSKLARSQDDIQVLKAQHMEKDHVIADLQLQLNAQKDENVTVSSLQASLSVTRAHLQKQLRQKDGDCNRMAVQIRTLESQLAQERIEVDHLRTITQRVKEKIDEDKEALKKVTRIQKAKVTKSKDELEHMHVQILDREAVIADQRVELDTIHAQLSKSAREKTQLDAEVAALRIRINELEGVMERMEDDTKQQLSQLTARLHDKSTENSSLRLDNDRLKMSLASSEDKLSASEADMRQLRASMREYEALVDEYRQQLNHTRREADESINLLEEQKREIIRARKDGEREIDVVKSQLENRLSELEPLPQLLNNTEMKLRDASDLLREYEKRHIDNVRMVNDLSAKLELNSAQLLESKQRSQQTQDESRGLSIKLDILEKKLASLEEQNRELMSTNAKREEGIQQATMRLDEKNSENTSLQRQLEATITDLKRQKELEREHISLSERNLQSRILDLESQLSQSRAEISRQKREKNELERSLNSRVDDLKSRLEASHSTNRTMQNYVHFLKSAYANAFNDSTLALNVSPTRTSLF